MKKAVSTFDDVWSYCTASNRLVPMPQHWNRVFELLKNKRQKPSGGWIPSMPLILAAWNSTMPIEKQLRFKEHIQWADDNNQLEEISDYLRALSESNWCHFGEQI